MRINLGCGYDKKPGFINIDANEGLEPDLVLELGATNCLLNKFNSSSIKVVLANDIIEHLFHWQAIDTLKDIYLILIDRGSFVLRLPDFEAIINSSALNAEEKIVLVFGGQDNPQSDKEPRYRKEHPELFCHKHAYTKESMTRELAKIGFKIISCETVGTNMVIECEK